MTIRQITTIQRKQHYMIKTVDFRDNTVAGVVAMDYHSNTANANMQIDNLYINDPSYVTPINVTATDVTVDKAQVVKTM